MDPDPDSDFWSDPDSMNMDPIPYLEVPDPVEQVPQLVSVEVRDQQLLIRITAPLPLTNLERKSWKLLLRINQWLWFRDTKNLLKKFSFHHNMFEESARK